MQIAKDNFVEVIAPIIINKCKERGYGVPSAIIAQAINESGWGQSSLASVYNNYFGMKCGGSWKGKSVNMATQEEYEVGVMTDISANFRVYDSIEAGVDGYFDFINYDRYKPVRESSNYRDYITNLKNCGYATSSQYVNNLIAIVESCGLSKYDEQETVAEPVIEAPVEQTNTDIYEVQSGDTLSALAQRFNTTVDNLVALNGIENPNLIYTGQKLRVCGEVPTKEVVTYDVVAGDTLWGIAQRFGTTVQHLVDVNGIANPDLIYVGQKLTI